MRVGLIGFAGSGKTTLFRALSGGRSAGNVSAVPLAADERLAFLAELERPKRVTPASVTIQDYPGLPPPGKVEERSALSGVRDETEGLILVVRGFATDAYFYPRPAPDPAADARDLVLELILTDLEVATRRIEKLEASVRKPTPRQEDERRELALLLRVREELEGEVPVKGMERTADEERVLRGFGFLTAKPWLLLVSQPDEGGAAVPDVEGPFEARRSFPVKLEADLMELEPSEREEFMADLSVEELHLPRFAEEILGAMGRIRFYTGSEKEVRAWEVETGSDAVTAAGQIHTDLARGFIRAEVVAIDDLREAGGIREAKAAGTYRVEGRDYVVKDGDLVHVRFSV